jgi:hypothetical protein
MRLPTESSGAVRLTIEDTSFEDGIALGDNVQMIYLTGDVSEYLLKSISLKYTMNCDVGSKTNIETSDTPKNYLLNKLICPCKTVTISNACGNEGTMRDMSCAWEDGTELPKCQNVETSCEYISHEIVCNTKGEAINEKGEVLDCIWVKGNSSSNPPVGARCSLKV